MWIDLTVHDRDEITVEPRTTSGDVPRLTISVDDLQVVLSEAKAAELRDTLTAVLAQRGETR